MATRKYVYLGQKKLSYSAAIREITGMSGKEFDTLKRVYRQRVKKFNELTGSKLSAIEELYYRVRFEDKRKFYQSIGKETKDYNSLQESILNISSSKKITAKDIQIARNDVMQRFAGLSQSNNKGRLIMEELQNANPNDVAAVKKAADEFKKLADIMHDLKENQPLEYISNVDYGNISGTP